VRAAFGATRHGISHSITSICGINHTKLTNAAQLTGCVVQMATYACLNALSGNDTPRDSKLPIPEVQRGKRWTTALLPRTTIDWFIE
jgi:hypothetical protein